MMGRVLTDAMRRNWSFASVAARAVGEGPQLLSAATRAILQAMRGAGVAFTDAQR